MRLFYCPKCGKEEIKNEYIKERDITYRNIRDGYGRPITHYKCECGNLLAGSVDISGWENDEHPLIYIKHVIKDYNKDGAFYAEGFYEFVEKNYLEKQEINMAKSPG